MYICKSRANRDVLYIIKDVNHLLIRFLFHIYLIYLCIALIKQLQDSEEFLVIQTQKMRISAAFQYHLVDFKC